LKANPATKNIPVVMFVAESGHDNVEKAHRLGVLKCLSKPFTGDALVAGLSPYIDFGRKAA
jgi:CheY-like chemotaxis protein